MRLAVGGDHAGFEYKAKLLLELSEQGHTVKDFGPYSDDPVDYPDFVHPVAEAVERGDYELAIMICGSANGVAMTANKHQKIRAAICWNNDLAALARQHNNANVICLPGRFISYEMASELVKTFITSEFEGGRHDRRVNKISC